MSAGRAAERDFTAASHEFDGNVSVRRLMFVVANVLVPATGIALADALSGEHYPPPLRWLPANAPWVAGTILAVGGALIVAVLARCEFGLVLNANKMRRALTGRSDPSSLNLLGVTTNFLLLTALSAAAGLMLALYAAGVPLVWRAVAALLAIALALGWLALQHRRANTESRALAADWQHGPIATSLQEDHVRRSLEATSADIAVVVTMGGALFAGLLHVTSNVGALPARHAELGLDVAALQEAGLPSVATFAALSLLLSCRMVVRLRIALAQHAARLAELRAEADDPWRFSPLERTYVLYLLLVLFLAIAALLVGFSLGGRAAGPWAAAIAAVAGLLWYPVRLRLARP